MTVPFLINFIPHKFSGDVCQSIEDMVSVSAQQRAPVTSIDYNIGSLDDISLPMAIKNITNNTSLEISVSDTRNAFLLNNAPLIGYTVTLGPGETNSFTVTLNKQTLDSVSNSFENILNVTIKNLTNGTVVTKNTTVSNLTVNFLDSTITTQ